MTENNPQPSPPPVQLEKMALMTSASRGTPKDHVPTRKSSPNHHTWCLIRKASQHSLVECRVILNVKAELDACKDRDLAHISIQGMVPDPQIEKLPPYRRARRARVVTTHTRAREVIHARGHTHYYMTGKKHYPCPLPAGAMCLRACPFTRHKLTVEHFNHKSPQAKSHYHNLKKGYSCTKFNNTSITCSSILDGGIYTNLTEGPHVSWFLRVNERSGHGN
uniref:Uncharacterized protein n=1 Tax=Oryza nivara TaxID=4536 RepID=A0A0E0IGR7_ORYNI